MSRSSSPAEPIDLRLLASAVGLAFLVSPVVMAASPTAATGDYLIGGLALAALIPVSTRVRNMPRLAISMSALAICYLVGSLYSAQPQQGLRHFLSTFSLSCAALLFATYGREMTESRLFRVLAYALTLTGIAAANFLALDENSLNKNLVGGATIYLLAVFFVLLIVDRPRTLWFYSVVFVAASVSLSIVFDFRSLAAYSVIVLIACVGSAKLSSRGFWWAGTLGAVAVVGTTTWFFLSIYTSPLAGDLAQRVFDLTGRRAASGREIIWGQIARSVQSDPWLGLGPGVLPRDLISINLSSHSTYMQTYLQLGVLGLALITAVLISAWRPLAYATSSSGRFGAAVFLMFICHNGTEVVMFQNAPMVALPAWCAIGMAIALSEPGKRRCQQQKARDRTAPRDGDTTPRRTVRRHLHDNRASSNPVA